MELKSSLHVALVELGYFTLLWKHPCVKFVELIKEDIFVIQYISIFTRIHDNIYICAITLQLIMILLMKFFTRIH